MPDQLYHRYEYDAENRLTDVYVADRKEIIGIPVLEEHDARYSYYKHGPLARTVLGQQLVQGIDYAYTLQGWLKGVNSDTLVDNDPTASATDAYRFSLNYFNGDYSAIDNSVKSIVFPGHSSKLPSGGYRPLYNGNISSMVVGIPQLGETRLYNYGYDQLNRLTKMDAYTGYNSATHTWEGEGGTLDDHGGEYKERIGYDGNGNILKYLRNGRRDELNMDSLSYHYNLDGNGYLANNKLNRVQDLSANTNFYSGSVGDKTIDIDNQPAGNYEYDAIGNLIKDSAENIRSITWTVYGKVKSITKTDNSKISYSYDVSGNRISKSVIASGDTTVTWYVRDAQGNPMAVYTSTSDSLVLAEHHLYGSSRLGVWNRNINMLVEHDPNNSSFVRGYKFFELPNHLGNVLVTISDKKFGQEGPPNVVTYYNPDVVNANDYYPFGMIMPGRKFSAGSLYRYGFNGKENDNDVKGEGNSQDYGMRIYDPRVGRFLSVDPITNEYPWLTPYQFSANSPIANVDLDGKESVFSATIAETDVRLAKKAANGDKDAERIQQQIHQAAWKMAKIQMAISSAVMIFVPATSAFSLIKYGILSRVFWWSVANPETAAGIGYTILVAASGYEGPDVPGPGDDFGRMGRKVYDKMTAAGIKDKEVLGDAARNAYNAIVQTIDHEIKDIVTLEEKAKKAFEIRNKAKDFAREMSGPELKEIAEQESLSNHGNINGPAFDDLFKKNFDEAKKKGLKDDAARKKAYLEIIESSKRTSKEKNKKYKAE